MRGTGKRDHTEGAIVAALVKAGCSVHYVDREVFDILVGRAGVTYALELKSPKGRLTERQEKFKDTWRGHYAICSTPTEALAAVGL